MRRGGPDPCCDGGSCSIPKSSSSKAKGYNFTAIFIMAMLVLPPLMAGLFQLWDAFHPEAAMQRNFRSRLVKCYSAANPEKLDSVDYILEKYKGREHILFSSLHTKYSKIPECKI